MKLDYFLAKKVLNLEITNDVSKTLLNSLGNCCSVYHLFYHSDYQAEKYSPTPKTLYIIHDNYDVNLFFFESFKSLKLN